MSAWSFLWFWYPVFRSTWLYPAFCPCLEFFNRVLGTKDSGSLGTLPALNSSGLSFFWNYRPWFCMVVTSWHWFDSIITNWWSYLYHIFIFTASWSETVLLFFHFCFCEVYYMHCCYSWIHFGRPGNLQPQLLS